MPRAWTSSRSVEVRSNAFPLLRLLQLLPLLNPRGTGSGLEEILGSTLRELTQLEAVAFNILLKKPIYDTQYKLRNASSIRPKKYSRY